MPNYVSSWVSLNYGRLTELDNITLAALELTAEALHTEVDNAQVMPFDTGNMQNAQTYVDTTDRYPERERVDCDGFSAGAAAVLSPGIRFSDR